MTNHWVPPLPHVLKINVHGIYSNTPSPCSNNFGIEAIYRNSERDLKLLTVGTIPFLTQLATQLGLETIDRLYTLDRSKDGVESF